MCNEKEPRRPIPDASEAIQALCAKASAFLDQLTGGQVIGIKPCPQLFPAWEIEIHLIKKGA